MKKQVLLVIFAAVSLLSGCSSGKDGGDAFGFVPDSFRLGAHLGAGEHFLSQKNYNLAEQEFKQALAIAKKTNDDTDLGECYTRLGQTYNRQKKNKEALDSFERANTAYEKADDLFLFKVDKRVWAQGLKEYRNLLQDAGDEERAGEAGDKWKELREELGAMEDLREKMIEF